LELRVVDDNIRAYYDQGRDQERLFGGSGSLELTRTQELLLRFLPDPPADILDVGGGPGTYASWLANAGYHVHLIDPIPLHVEQAAEAAVAQPDHPFTAAIGDARALEAPDTTCDAVLLLGPLYHLTERSDRITALSEAQRVLRPGGVVLAVGISRFGSLLDALRQGVLNDPEARSIIERALGDGQHRNPGMERYPGWFTTAYFHLPGELADEVTESGLALEALLGIEGPGGFVGDGWKDPEQRPHILHAARAVEAEPSLLGLSAHILAVARKGC
jgi:ubiquinone/menaquinone biosynthesis C-methylase UbiE